ncbi:MAG: type II toxin-antitoxin system RelE/ParE family toxin [Pseudomonas sp.]|jgi:plasmid stabilization system protein ParE|nr:type II toxin-antitoxin system RelE/ParE family toxin [Pseudomonas sp.]PHR97310.1 MAG: addiction module toxin RelE [Oceanobacter sp.]
MKISFSNSALEDLKEVQAYYNEQEVPEVGSRHLTEIFERVESLPDNPQLGRVVPEFDEPHIREIIHPPYRIVYMLDSKSIQIIRVWRSERLLVLPDSEA